MTRRESKLVLLCEDRQHEAFLRRFLKLKGWHPRAMRVERSPMGSGSGEQWVRERCYPKELRSLRVNHVSAKLMVMIDGDRSSPAERAEAFDRACDAQDVPRREPDEPVAYLVPTRNIETWIVYLGGEDVDEKTVYPKLERERECADAVKALEQMCGTPSLRRPAPPSLTATCDEYGTRIQ